MTWLERLDVADTTDVNEEFNATICRACDDTLAELAFTEVVRAKKKE